MRTHAHTYTHTHIHIYLYIYIYTYTPEVSHAHTHNTLSVFAQASRLSLPRARLARCQVRLPTAVPPQSLAARARRNTHPSPMGPAADFLRQTKRSQTKQRARQTHSPNLLTGTRRKKAWWGRRLVGLALVGPVRSYLVATSRDRPSTVATSGLPRTQRFNLRLRLWTRTPAGVSLTSLTRRRLTRGARLRPPTRSWRERVCSPDWTGRRSRQ